MAHVAAAQQLVLQHRAERRRDRHRQLERHAIAQQPLHHRDERDVGFGDRFEEPVFLEELVVLRMAHERQVRVKNRARDDRP